MIFKIHLNACFKVIIFNGFFSDQNYIFPQIKLSVSTLTTTVPGFIMPWHWCFLKGVKSYTLHIKLQITKKVHYIIKYIFRQFPSRLNVGRNLLTHKWIYDWIPSQHITIGGFPPAYRIRWWVGGWRWSKTEEKLIYCSHSVKCTTRNWHSLA